MFETLKRGLDNARENLGFERMLRDKAALLKQRRAKSMEDSPSSRALAVKLYPIGRTDVEGMGQCPVFLSSDGAIYIRNVQGDIQRLSTFDARDRVHGLDALIERA